MVTSYRRGHQIELRDDDWYYSDTDELADHDRPCIRCGKEPTIEGYDACIGHVPNAKNACCGHGIVEPTVEY